MRKKWKNFIRILFALNSDLRWGGTENVVMNIYRNIDKERFQIDFLIYEEENDTHNQEIYNEILKNNRICHVTPISKNAAKSWRDTRRIIKNGNYNAVHSHMDSAGAFVLLCALFSGCQGRIAHAHNTKDMNDYKGIKKKGYQCLFFLMRHMIRAVSNQFIACSEQAAVWLFGKKKAQKAFIFYNAVEPERFRFQETARRKIREQYGWKEQFIWGNVGRISTQKNQEMILRLFYRYQKINPEAILILLGEGEEQLKRYLQNMCIRMGIQEKVLFAGHADNVEEYLSAMDLFVFPSIYEGFGISVLEAQINGLSVICSDAVPKEIQITPNIVFADVKEDEECWMDKILELSAINRKHYVKLPTGPLLDNDQNIQNLQTFYGEMTK